MKKSEENHPVPAILAMSGMNLVTKSQVLKESDFLFSKGGRTKCETSMMSHQESAMLNFGHFFRLQNYEVFQNEQSEILLILLQNN